MSSLSIRSYKSSAYPNLSLMTVIRLTAVGSFRTANLSFSGPMLSSTSFNTPKTREALRELSAKSDNFQMVP